MFVLVLNFIDFLLPLIFLFILGGYGGCTGKIEIIQQICHPGEVNRARYNWHNPDIIATKTASNDVYIFDKTVHPSKPSTTERLDKQVKPQLVLQGHKKEGYGLSWSPHHAGQLLSGSDDAMICMWDIGQQSASLTTSTPNNIIQPTTIYNAHTDIVEVNAFLSPISFPPAIICPSKLVHLNIIHLFFI